MKKFIIIFVAIAERDIDFYLDAIKELTIHHPDWQYAIASLYQPGRKKVIQQEGVLYYDTYNEKDAYSEITPEDITRLEIEYGIENFHRMTLHESVTFGVVNLQLLYLKFANYLRASDNILSTIKTDFNNYTPVIIQELGGFIGPLSYYYSAVKHKIDHYFLEPAFFKGRILFNKNSLNVIVDSALFEQTIVAPQVIDFIKETISQKTVVSAIKDQHHYQDMSLKKICNATNAKKVFRKLWLKYVMGQKQEYDHVANHILRYLRMFVNRKLNNKSYLKDLLLLEKERFFYFPFHVQLDYSLTVRSPEYLDQLGLIENILKVLPAGIKIAAKEHPASIGCLPYDRTKKNIQKENFILLHPSLNSYDIIKMSLGVVTINSKVGAEALLLNKFVFVFGNSFYSHPELVILFNNWKAFECGVRKVSLNSTPVINNKIQPFFSYFWNKSQPTELYWNEPQNIQNFTKAICLEIQS